MSPAAALQQPDDQFAWKYGMFLFKYKADAYISEVLILPYVDYWNHS